MIDRKFMVGGNMQGLRVLESEFHLLVVRLQPRPMLQAAAVLSPVQISSKVQLHAHALLIAATTCQAESLVRVT